MAQDSSATPASIRRISNTPMPAPDFWRLALDGGFSLSFAATGESDTSFDVGCRARRVESDMLCGLELTVQQEHCVAVMMS